MAQAWREKWVDSSNEAHYSYLAFDIQVQVREHCIDMHVRAFDCKAW